MQVYVLVTKGGFPTHDQMIQWFSSSLIRYACGLTLIGFLYNERMPEEGNDMAITLSKTDRGNHR